MNSLVDSLSRVSINTPAPRLPARVENLLARGDFLSFAVMQPELAGRAFRTIRIPPATVRRFETGAIAFDREMAAHPDRARKLATNLERAASRVPMSVRIQVLARAGFRWKASASKKPSASQHSVRPGKKIVRSVIYGGVRSGGVRKYKGYK